MDQEEDDKKTINFHQMELDDRILKVNLYFFLKYIAKIHNLQNNQAIAKQGWSTPTLIQESAIPLLLEGKDVLVRARTGSGKTGAFVIPVIQKILNSKINATTQNTSTLILAPSKELCHQVNIFKYFL